jgi:glycine oxidase
MTLTRDVVVVGGGVIGLTAAYEFMQAGLSAVLVDRGDLGREASWAGAGIIPPADTTAATTPWAKLRALSVARFPSLSEELRQRTGVDNGYRRCGGLEFTDGDGTDDEWRSEGVACTRLTPAQLQEIDPLVRPTGGSVWHLPDLAQLRNPRHLKALIAACGDRVLLLSGCPALRLQTNGPRVVAVETAAGTFHAGHVLVAGGAWTDGLLEPLGVKLGITPVRGQIVLLSAQALPIRSVLLHGSRYIVPRGDGRFLVGSSEEDVGFNKQTTVEVIQELLTLARRLVPRLGAASIERCWAGLRPGSPDGLPFLGRVSGLDNLYVAAGHYRAGIQLSAGTAQVMKELLLGQSPAVPLEAFRLDRQASRVLTDAGKAHEPAS